MTIAKHFFFWFFALIIQFVLVMSYTTPEDIYEVIEEERVVLMELLGEDSETLIVENAEKYMKKSVVDSGAVDFSYSFLVPNINSDPDRGTTINVLFPIIAEEPEKDIVPSKDLPTGKETVLFIDDENALVNMGRHILVGLGYKVETRTDSVEALDLFRSSPDRFDLIITDMTMPKMTGDQLVKEILHIRPEIPIILCTGFSEKIDEAKASAIGVRKYIEKPLDRRKLAEAVRGVLDVN